MCTARPIGKGLQPVDRNVSLHRSILIIDRDYAAPSVNPEGPSATDAVVAIVIGMEGGAAAQSLDCKQVLPTRLAGDLRSEQPPPGVDRRSRLPGAIGCGEVVDAISAGP